MAKKGKVYGVDINEDMDPALLRRDTRSIPQKISDIYYDHGAFLVLIIGLAIIANAFIPLGPKIPEFLFAFGFISHHLSSRKVRGYPLAEPISTDPKVQKKQDFEKFGMYIMGNEYGHSGQLWLTSNEFKTHVLVFGTTGSGKTRFLLGVMYQSMLTGTGCMYVDGKGDNTVWWLVYSFARRADRVDDLLIINYLTGGKSLVNKKLNVDYEDKKISNTTNPLSQGTAEQLRSLLVGLMRESGGEGEMWKGRSSAMLKALLETLVFMRDIGELNLDIDSVRHYMVLDRILELSQRTDIPEIQRLPLKKYLLELPGFTEEDAAINQINPECYKQHNFLTMQLTEVMSDLSGTYGHIFRAELGEVDFKDLVFNSRILFVMLPALEKDPDALGGLGKMIVAGVRSALAPALGENVEGSKASVVDKKPTNSLEPFMLILDEYGYYAVKGFSVAAAQARSLGVGIIFAGQDFAGFKKASEEEAQQILANTTTKVGMKLEDIDTANKFIERGGKGKISQTEGYDKASEGSDNFKDKGGARAEDIDVINSRDLVVQGAGEAHFIRGDEVYRGRVFFADPYEVSFAELNKFLMVNRPSAMDIETMEGTFNKLQSLMDNAEEESGVEESSSSSWHIDEGLRYLFRDHDYVLSRGKTGARSAAIAIGMSSLYTTLKDKEEENDQLEKLTPESSGPDSQELNHSQQGSNSSGSVNSGSSKKSESSSQVSGGSSEKEGADESNKDEKAGSGKFSIKDKAKRVSPKGEGSVDSEPKKASVSKSKDLEDAKKEYTQQAKQNNGVEGKGADSAVHGDDEVLEVVASNESPSVSGSVKDDHVSEFAEIFNESIMKSSEELSDSPMSQLDLASSSPKEKIEKAESVSASGNFNRSGSPSLDGYEGIDIISEKTRSYPSGKTPSKRKEEDLLQELADLEDNITMNSND